MLRKVMGFVLAALAGACGGEARELDETGSEHSEIVSGTNVSSTDATNLGMVAVYHMVQPPGGTAAWFPRPCTGTVVAHRAGSAYVLTGRHCVTVTGKMNAALVSPVSGWLSIAPGYNPGLLVGGQPPSSAVAATGVVAMLPMSETDRMRDVALIRVVASWSHLMVANKAIFMGNPTGLSAFSTTAYGYGINVASWSCQDDGGITTGAGRLRKATFVIESGVRESTSVGGSFWYDNTNSSSQAIICGDSGGPDLGNVASDMSWPHVFGVHSGASVADSVSTAAGPWVSQALDGLILSPMSATTSHLRRRSDGIILLEPSSPFTQFEYHPPLKQIYSYDTGERLCLAWDDEADSLRLGTCDTTDNTQKWEVAPFGYIRNTALNLCVRHMTNGWVEIRQCPAASATQSERARFTWLWRGKT